MSIAGTKVARVEDHKLITSGGTYVEDLREQALTGAVHATFVRSPIAHARVTSIDTSEARSAPGVVGVYTAEDIDLGKLPAGPVPQPWLADGVVRYVGEPVALVLTEERYQLADAAELVDVDYDPLDVVASIDDALADETVLFPDQGTNVMQTTGGNFDDAAFDGCEVVVTQTIVNQRVAAAPLEVRGAACAWGADGRLTAWLSTQNAQMARMILGAGLGVGEDQIRVVAPDVGGGFGAKIGADPEVTVLAWASKNAGRPVRWVETRSENMTSMTHGRAQQNTVTIGGRRDGTVEVFRLDVLQDAGAYPRTLFLPTMTELMASGVYRFPKLETRTRGVVTNTTPISAYRGAGRPEATAAIERGLDLFAAEIGMDPADVRKVNFIRPEEFPYSPGTGVVYDTGEYATALDRALETAGYADLRAEQQRRRADGDPVALGVGIASYVEITAGDPGGGESGRVDIHADGTVTAYTGSSPHGQGLHTTLTMLLSDQLGVPMDKITIKHGDSDEIPTGVGTFGSRSLQMGGSALRQAADKVIDSAKAVAAELLEASADDMELNVDDGVWQVRGAATGGSVTWAQVAERADEPLTADVWYEATPTFPFGAHVAVVEVDTETGKVELKRIVAVDDAGPVVNPVTFNGQRHGGLGQGSAQALLEVMDYDADGNPTTATLADYSFISATELPDFELVDMETPTDRNLLGVKGIGEAATIGSTPAVHNAVVDALAHLGVKHMDMPTTPLRVWQALTAGNDARKAG